MYQSLITYISKNSGISPSLSDVTLIKETFIPRVLRKRQYFLQMNDFCKHFCFIVKGAMRQYSIDERGAEHVIHLGIEDWWMGDLESIFMLRPSRYNIDAWENCNLLTIRYADLFRLVEEIPSFGRMVQLMEEKNLILNQSRLNATLSLSADYRYVNFTEDHPDFLQRFPLHIIASYLGITKETLSRIRGK